jgi:hypothetical protein
MPRPINMQFCRSIVSQLRPITIQFCHSSVSQRRQDYVFWDGRLDGRLRAGNEMAAEEYVACDGTDNEEKGYTDAQTSGEARRERTAVSV